MPKPPHPVAIPGAPDVQARRSSPPPCLRCCRCQTQWLESVPLGSCARTPQADDEAPDGEADFLMEGENVLEIWLVGADLNGLREMDLAGGHTLQVRAAAAKRMAAAGGGRRR